MSSSIKDHLDFLRLLAITHKKQRLQLLRTINNSQFDILIEVVYHILKGVCSLTKEEEVKIKKKQRTFLRQFIDKKVNKRVKKDILIRIQSLIPTLLSSVKRYLINNGKRGRTSSERKILEIAGRSRDDSKKSERDIQLKNR